MKEKDIRDPRAHGRYLEMVRKDAATFFGDPSVLEQTPCPACGASESRKEFDKFGFTYVSCPGCRTLYVSPRPKTGPLKEFYVQSASSRFWVEEFFKPVAEARREKIFRPRAALVAESFPELAGETVGDVGAGFGLFLEELRRFWPSARLVAVEPAPEMAALCRGKGLSVEESTIEDLQGHDETFALLTAFELFEHLHTPRALVAKAFRLLRPGGRLLLTTLNGEGFDIQLLWENSRSVFPPHHLNFFNPESLADLCRSVGFVIERVETPGLLDWPIVEGALEREEATLERFWCLLRSRGSAECKADLQQWISRHRLSSHLRLIALKPNV